VLGLLLLVGQIVAFPMQGSIAPLRLLQAALVHELEQAAGLTVRAGATNRLCSLGHRALLRTPSGETATAGFRSAADKSGLLNNRMRHIGTAQGGSSGNPPVLLLS
jgi:hypothetical protein